MRPVYFLHIIAFLVLLGCAPRVKMVSTEIAYHESNNLPGNIVIEENLRFSLSTGYGRSLKEGSLWKYVGTIPQGDVYKPVKNVFTVEGSNIYEAYIVLFGKELVGVYLPVEAAFSLLKEKKSLKFRKISPRGGAK